MNGQVSYSALADIAIKYTFPGIVTDENDHDCTLTYYDIDNDCVTIGSTEELVDAIDQFSINENPVLRITADVKRKEDLSVPVISASEPNQRSDKASPSINMKPNQLQSIVESCVSVLAAAVVTLQNQIAEVSNPPNNSSEADASGSTGRNSPKTDAENVSDEGVGDSEVKTRDEVNEGLDHQRVKDLPFIHGRHTCDGCLCTPIIGTRYHATNLPDYDLCAACRGNYKGTEIHFEEQQLDRDLPFQDRWYRKRARLSGHGHGSPCRALRDRRGRGGWHRAEHDAGMDDALKEAIRRSLQDIPTEQQKSEPSDAADGSSVVNNGITEFVQSAVRPDDSTAVTESDDFASVHDVNVSEPVVDTSFSSDAIGHGDAAESLGNTLDHLAHAIDAVVSEIDRQHPIHSIDVENMEEFATSRLSSANTFVEDTTDLEAASGEKIVDGEDGVIDEASEASEDEWQVVKDDYSDQVPTDEMMARAAQLIGSALFQSDLMGSADGKVSGSTQNDSVGGSDSFSLPSTVPSLLSDNQISRAVLDRWALQLHQLHELGFDDDLKNVEILERINASLIGVDSDDEVSVTQVINALLKN